MHPSVHAESQPDKPAIVMAATGEVTTYAELEAQSNRVAQLLRSRDIGIEDPVAVCLDNDALYFPLAWGINRAGGLMVAISNRLTATEICYILKDSGAKLLFCTEAQSELFDAVAQECEAVPQLRVRGTESVTLPLRWPQCRQSGSRTSAPGPTCSIPPERQDSPRAYACRCPKSPN